MMNGVLQRFGYFVRKFGWMRLTGLATGGSAILFYVAIGVPAEYRLQSLEADAARALLNTGPREESGITGSPGVSMLSFYRSLPSEHAIPELLEKIFDAAFENNLVPERGEFRFMRAEQAGFARYQIVLPILGNYSNIRQFVNRVLQEIPSASLDDIVFSREDARDAEVEAKVHFTLHLGTAQ